MTSITYLTVRYKTSINQTDNNSYLLTMSQHVGSVDEPYVETRYGTARPFPSSCDVIRSFRCGPCPGAICAVCYIARGRTFLEMFSLALVDPLDYDAYVQEEYPEDFVPI